jgi:hypothetical protein
VRLGHRQHRFGQARALDVDGGSAFLDLAQVVGGQLNVGRAQVFFEPVELGGAGDGRDVRDRLGKSCLSAREGERAA